MSLVIPNGLIIFVNGDKLPMEMKNILVNDLVVGNSVFAYVLHYFGIAFYQYPDNTLEEACNAKNLDVNKVIASLNSAVDSKTLDKHELVHYPIDLIVEYLKHSHHVFAKYKLPYLNALIASFDSDSTNDSLIEDLKYIFPSFNREFVEHIYEEEDELFGYVMALNQYVNEGKKNDFEIREWMGKYSLQVYAMEHGMHESGMEGIRKITHDYRVSNDKPAHLRVIMNSLLDFERELILHARIENEIFFPKALQLEGKAKQLMVRKSYLN